MVKLFETLFDLALNFGVMQNYNPRHHGKQTQSLPSKEREEMSTRLRN